MHQYVCIVQLAWIQTQRITTPNIWAVWTNQKSVRDNSTITGSYMYIMWPLKTEKYSFLLNFL